MERRFIEQNIINVLKETHFEGLGERRQGKVRDIYTQDDKIVLISTDRHSSFDRIIAHIPFKGQVLTEISTWWFEHTKDIVPNHVIAVPDPNVVVAKKCQTIPIEMVVRGFITGVTDTALWTRYSKGERDFGGFTLPEGMLKNDRLSEPVLTPTTKSDEHDRNLTPRQIIAEGIVDKATWSRLADIATRLFKRGQEIAAQRGLILVDTKYEFGLTPPNPPLLRVGKGGFLPFPRGGVGGVGQQEIILIDEIHTPDSSRYWKADTYEERFAAGAEPEYFDKEFLRLWFKEHCDPYKDSMLPEAPREMIVELASRYIQIYEQITGEEFRVDLGKGIEERIQKNLKDYFQN